MLVRVLLPPCLLAALYLSPRPAHGQGLDPPPAGAAGLALGGVGAVSLPTPAALWTNPSLIAGSARSVALELGLRRSDRSLVRTDVVNQTAPARDTAAATLAPAISIAVPVWRPWLWAGLAYHLHLRADSEYPPQVTKAGASRLSPGRYRGTSLDLQQHMISLGLAAHSRYVALGASLELSHLRLAHRQSLWAGTQQDQPLNENPLLDVDAQLEAANVAALGGLLGITLRPWSFLEIGGAVRLPFTARLDGSMILAAGTRAPYGYTSISAKGGDARTDLPLPLEVRAGVGVGPARLKLLVEVAYSRWSAASGLAAQLEGAALQLKKGTTAPLEQRPIERLALGVELDDRFSVHGALVVEPWPGVLWLRSGYAFHHGATRPEAPSSVLLDLDHHVWSLGLEAGRGAVRFGVAFAQSFEASLDAPGDRALLQNPLSPSVTIPVGRGQYAASAIAVAFESSVSF